MACPHSLKGNPAACSQCIGAPVKRVTLTISGATIDGITARPIVPPQTWKTKYKRSAQRGGRATARRTGRV
jgi:hypothetical protein